MLDRNYRKISKKKDVEYVGYKNYERKTKSPFMIFAGFESILVLEEYGKQNPDESNKYQKHITCCCGYKLVCVDDKFSQPFNSFSQK